MIFIEIISLQDFFQCLWILFEVIQTTSLNKKCMKIFFVQLFLFKICVNKLRRGNLTREFISELFLNLNNPESVPV